LLEGTEIKKAFKNPVLQGISIKTEPAKIIGLAGENGSGKSTLLSILAGIMPPDSGNVLINGKPLKQADLKRIGYVPQENALFENLSVRDNLRFWSAAYGTKPEEASRIFPDYDDIYKKKAADLSGGMAKRLSIALGLLNKPDYLILDEPTAFLDIGFKGMLRNLLQDLKNEGKGIIFTTHQPDELMWCEKIYILRNGKFVYEGEPVNIDDLSKLLYGRINDGDHDMA